MQPGAIATGMRIALEHERSQGRGPEDLSFENLGYDIRSTASDGAVRYVEVKARARTGAIALTPNEWLMAQWLGDEYWLYVVEHAATVAELHTIQDPAAKLHPDEVVEVVRYVVRDSKRAAARRKAVRAEVEVDTVSGHIEITPGVAAGKPRIAGHRITVQDIVIWYERVGLSADEIATEYGLSLADVYAALTYYYDHREEIDRAIRADEEFIAELRKRIPSKLRTKLGG